MRAGDRRGRLDRLRTLPADSAAGASEAGVVRSVGVLLYAIERELQSINRIEDLGVEVHAVLGSVMQRRRCAAVMKAFGIHTVYHAAAYKHVPWWNIM